MFCVFELSVYQTSDGVQPIAVIEHDGLAASEPERPLVGASFRFKETVSVP